MDMKMNQSTVTPVQRTQLPRFTGEGRWVLCDMTVDSSRVAVCGYNEDTSSIDLFRFNYPDSSSPLITGFYSKEFKDHSRWPHRSVSVLDDSRIVTVCGNMLNVFNIKTDDIHSELLPDKKAACMTVREGGIFIGLHESYKVIAFEFSLNQIKTITLRELKRNEWLVGITVCGDNLFISTSRRNARRYNMEGVLLQEYKIPGSSACSITVCSDFGLVFVSCDLPLPVVVYSLSEGHTLFTSRVIDGDDLHRIRINDVNRYMFTTSKQGILRVHSTASILTFSHLKEELSSKLTQTDCGNLGRYFSLLPDRVQTIITSPLHSKNFLLALEERGYIHPSNVNRLTDALTELKINHTHLLTETYMKLRDQNTEYERFLAGLSAHLTFSITVKLCDNFQVTDENKNTVISSQNPGHSFLLKIDEMGIIYPSDVSKLETPLEEYRLLQAVAKIHEYQSLVLSDKTMPQVEDKESLFLKCLQQKMKSWFETMTPVPWMKSCQWKSLDLFIASRLVLTNSGSNISSREVDRKYKLHYRDIFTDERLKAETRIILEGQPGSGKTMLSSQLAYYWYCGKLMDIPMVIYLPLKIVDDMTITQSIKMFYIHKGIPMTEEDIESMLNSDKKRVYLILDGLEEYNGGTKDGSPSEVMRVMTKEKLSNCIAIITARTDYAKHLPPGPMLKIGSFGEDERDEYIEKVYSDDQTRQEEVKELIDNVPFILDLCNVPLLFVLLVHNIDRLGKLQEGQLNRVTPFVKAIVDILCPMQDEEDKHSHLSDQKTYITLEELAFNGLCKGNQQLFWQKDFVDRSVTNSKAWIDSGILVVEEGTLFHSPSRDLQTDSGSGSLQTDSISDESLNACSVTSEIKRGVSLEPDHMASVNQSKNKPILEPKEKKSKSLQKGKAAKHISLHVKFLHKLIQEWFAAKYLALLFFGHKSTEHHYKYQLFGEHLANVDPADLHYILRFTCHICPSSFHFIASFLMRDFKTEDGEIPDYIINCICLCFAEYDGYKGHKFKDIFTEICRRESVNFSSEDSRLLLMSKVSMLTSASRSQIPIKCLKISDVVEKITEKALILKADVSLGVLNTLRAIEVNRWDQKLIEQDYEDLIKFIINNEKVEVARLLLPSPPVAVKDEKVLSNLQSRNISVEWIIGANLIHTLNVTTGEWMMEFRLPGRMSANSSSLKPISDNLPSNPLHMELCINKDGGVLEIPDTGVSLEIPPGALEKDQLIQMRIIPYNFQGDSDLSFSSNSSVVVELLPSNLKLLKPAKLTLPHCLVLKKGCEWKAKIYSSHHEEGNHPLWKPLPDTPYLLNQGNCIIELRSFSWKKFEICDKIVTGKHIVLYAAKHLPSHQALVHIDVGVYLDLEGGEENVSMNKVSVLRKKSALLLKEGQLPLKFYFVKTEPPVWNIHPDEGNLKEIPFTTEDILNRSFCTFVFNKKGTMETDKCSFYFKAGQEPYLTDLTFVLEDGVEDSAASSSDKLVDAGLSQSQKRTDDDSLTVKQPLRNSDPEVRTESLRNVSASSLSGNPVSSQSADVPHSKKRGFNESTAVVMDVSASSLSGFPVPSQSVDVPHSKKRRFNEYTAVVMDGVEDPAASSFDKLVDAGLSQSQKRTGDESQTAKQPLENIDLQVRTESLRNPSLPSHQAIGGEAEGNPAGAEATTTDSKKVTDETLQDVSVAASSPSDSSVPSKSGNVPQSEKRCIDKSTAEVKDVPMMGVSTEPLADCSVPSKSGNVPHSLDESKAEAIDVPMMSKITPSRTVHEEQGSMIRTGNIKLRTFSCEKLDNGDEGKRIVLYAAKHLPSHQALVHIDVGFYLDIEGGEENVSMNKVSVLRKKSGFLFKKRKLPLKFRFVKTEPPDWNFSPDEENPKEIPYDTAANLKGSYCTFVFNKKVTMETDKCSCYFKAGQESHLTDLTFVLEVGGQDSAASSSNKLVDAGLSQSQKKTCHESQTVNTPIENIDLKVSQKDLEVLSEEITRNWKKLGRKLGLENKLYNLEKNSTNQEHKETVYQMLLAWVQKNGSKATYRVLGEALIAADRRDLQEALYKQDKCFAN